MPSPEKTLLVTGSILGENSNSAAIGRALAAKLSPEGYRTRDTAGIAPIDGAWLAGVGPDAPADSPAALLSNELIEELRAAEDVVIAVPIYNFGPSAQLKAWVDHVCRAGVTFRYSEAGPEGLLKGRVWIAVASGGVPAGSEADFASTWLKQVMGFIGFEIAGVIAAGGVAVDPDSVSKALEEVEALDLAA